MSDWETFGNIFGWLLVVGVGAYLLWGSWQLFRLVTRRRGLDLDAHEREQRELRDSARYPRDPR